MFYRKFPKNSQLERTGKAYEVNDLFSFKFIETIDKISLFSFNSLFQGL